MAVRATISKGYIWRPGLIGIAALVFSGWFLYDGMVKYPLQKQQFEEYQGIYQEHTDPTEAGRAWEVLAREKGWSTGKPTQKTDKDIFTQKLLAGITAPIGLGFMFVFLTSLGKWVEADEKGLRTKSGKETDYASIKSIDKSRWKTKGIAVVHYESNSKADQITLDDWKFDREPTKRIMQAIEERTGLGDDETPAEDEAGETPRDVTPE